MYSPSNMKKDAADPPSLKQLEKGMCVCVLLLLFCHLSTILSFLKDREFQ